MTNPSLISFSEKIIENDYLRIVVSPQCAGKLRSLIDKRSGLDWLWKNPFLSLRRPVYGESYAESLDFGGWDEVCPSVAPCVLRGGQVIPDHGDAAQLPWEWLEGSAEHCTMQVHLRSLPFCLERRIVLRGPEIELKYQLKNLGSSSHPWMWCAHPLLPFNRDYELYSDGAFTVHSSLGAAKSLSGRTIRLSALPARDVAWTAKLFSESGAVDTVQVRHSSGARLRFDWETREIPHLALWLNNGGWSGAGTKPYFNMGIEPTTLPLDDLSAAEQASVLRPGAKESWSLFVRII